MSFAEFKEMVVEIGDYLYSRYICLDLSQYRNFDFGARNTTVAKIILLSLLGCMIAALILYINKRHARTLTKALLDHGCTDEQSAKSATELGVSVSRRLRYSLRRPSALSKIIYFVGQTHVTAESTLLHDTDFSNADGAAEHVQNESQSNQKKGKKRPSYAAALQERRSIDFQAVGLYIPKPLTYRAEVRFAGKQESFLMLLIALVILPAAGLVILRFLPQLLGLADSLISFMNQLLS